MLTLSQFLEIFCIQHLATLTNGRQVGKRLRLVTASWAHRRLSEITHLEVMTWHRHLASQPSRANACLSALSTLYAKAIDWGYFTGANPCHRVRKLPEKARTRYVRPSEWPIFQRAIARQDPDVQAYFITLLCTGSRRSEVAQLQWTDVDLSGEVGLWTKARTKNRDPHLVPIVEPALSRLRALPHVASHIFVTRGGKPWPTSKIERLWYGIRCESGLHDVCIHDLRRTTASWLCEQGVSLPIISAILGHRDYQTTRLYIRGLEHGTAMRQALSTVSASMFGV